MRYKEQSEQLKLKEGELEKLEIRSKELLFQAHEDAQECIKYFKGLAFSGNQVGVVSQKDQDANRSPDRVNMTNSKSAGRAAFFPTSLGPIR